MSKLTGWDAFRDLATSTLLVITWLSLIGGAAYMIEWRGWSEWWMLAAVFMCFCIRDPTNESDQP